jgi:hypothetical protein
MKPMRNRILASGRVLIVWSAFLLAGGPTAPSNAQSENALQHRKGTPLSQLVKGRPREVVIEKDQSPPLYIEPPRGTAQLEWITSLAPFVLIVHVDTLDAALTPEEDWVTTAVTARIEQVLKKPAGDPVSEGSSIRFQQDGGDINLTGTLVHAVLPWTEGLKESRRYLVFATRLTALAGWQLDTGTAYDVTSGGHLRPLARRGKALSEANVPLETAVSRIRATARKHQ